MPYLKRSRYSPYARPSGAVRTRAKRRAATMRKRVRGSKYGFNIRPHLFHRWMTSFPSANLNLTNCTYDVSNSVLTTNTGVSTASASMYFTLADIPNVSEFTTLFDFYRLNRVLVTIKMIPVPDATNQPASTTLTNFMNWYPTIWYVRDQDDNSSMTLPQIKEFEKVKHKVLSPNREVKIILRPTTLTQTYRSTLTTGYKIDTSKQYIDIAQSDVPHYGLKTVIDLEGLTTSGDAARQWQFKINAKYYFTTKNVR